MSTIIYNNIDEAYEYDVEGGKKANSRGLHPVSGAFYKVQKQPKLNNSPILKYMILKKQGNAN